MSNFLLITKINLMSFFDVKKVTNSKYNRDVRRNIFKIILFILVLAYFSFYIYQLVSFMMPGFILNNNPLDVLGVMFFGTSFFIIFYNVFKVKTILFDFKDYDLLMSLPLKRSTIILSKIVSTYLLNLLYTLIIMVPTYFAYIQFLKLSSPFLYFSLLFIIPIVPLLISFLLGIIISWITSFFKNKNLGSYVINLSIIFLVLLISFKMNNMNAVDLANKSTNILSKTNGFYPLTTIFTNMLNNFQITDLLLFLFTPVALLGLFIFIINKGYISIRERLLRSVTKGNYEIKTYHDSGALMALYRKELKKFVSNSMYLLNTIFGCIMIVFLVVCLLIFDDNAIGKILSVEDFGVVLKNNIIFVIALACSISSTTHPSISLEGKSLWIMKMLPVNSTIIFLSKIMVNLTFLIPTILISGTFFGIHFHFEPTNFILLYLTPLAYAIFISVLGIILNLLFPKFDFSNEVKVIKQSLPSFLVIFAGIVAVAFPLIIGDMSTKFLILVTSVMYFVDIVLIIILNVYGSKRIKSL